MNLELYTNIVSLIRHHRGLSRDCLKKLKQNFPHLSSDTLFSILSSEYQKRMKVNHVKTPSNKNKYWNLYTQAIKNRDSPGILVRLAQAHDVAPCLLAKVILSRYFEESEEVNISTNMNVYLRDTNLIPDMDLSYEVFLCTLYDNLYSPLIEAMKCSLGQQYEIKLYKEVSKLGLAYRDEEHLRKYGYDKTPDCKLDVPVVIDGCIINWIESKALFGDEDAHREYMKNQYHSYWNRFGPGLVIYWFGFLETIVEPNDKRFIIKDSLPDNIIHLPPPNFDFKDSKEVESP